MSQVAMQVVTFSHLTTITMYAVRMEHVSFKSKPASSSWQLRCLAQRSLEGFGPRPLLQLHLGHTCVCVCVSLGILYPFSHSSNDIFKIQHMVA